MTGMIIHDLKNPLNSIIHLARMKDVPDKEELIWQSGKSMLNLVMNIFDVNKSQDTNLIVNKQKINFCELIDAALLDVSINAKLRDILINKKYFGSFVVEGDPEVLKRVCVNLLSNAIKYSPAKGQINIKVQKHSNAELILLVEDEGPGIRDDLRKVLFDQSKSHGKFDKSMRSSGLGLTFCKMAVEAHEGSVGVESPKETGAQFFITLPAKCQDSKQQYQEEEVVRNASYPARLAASVAVRLHPYLDQLQLKEVYEVSDIKGIIGQMKALGLEGIENWLKELEEAVIACNNEKYQITLKRMQHHEI